MELDIVPGEGGQSRIGVHGNEVSVEPKLLIVEMVMVPPDIEPLLGVEERQKPDQGVHIDKGIGTTHKDEITDQAMGMEVRESQVLLVAGRQVVVGDPGEVNHTVRVAEDLGVVEADDTFLPHKIVDRDITDLFRSPPPGLLDLQELETVLGEGDTPKYTYHDPGRYRHVQYPIWGVLFTPFCPGVQTDIDTS
jgi:hypothetical protein